MKRWEKLRSKLLDSQMHWVGLKEGSFLSKLKPNPNNQSAKVVNTEKFEEVKSVTNLRSGKEIGNGTPKANEKSKETPIEKDESGIAKSNDIEKCPFPAPFPQALKLQKNLDVTNEILEHLHQVKVNLPLLYHQANATLCQGN